MSLQKNIFLNMPHQTKVKWLDDVKNTALKKLEKQGFPTSKQEEWRHTKFEPQDYDKLIPFHNKVRKKVKITSSIKNAYNIVLVNGKIQQKDQLPVEIKIVTLSDLLKDESRIDIITQVRKLLQDNSEFNKSFNPLLNIAFLKDPLIIYLDKEADIKQTINLFHVGASPSNTVYSHIITLLSQSSKCAIFEHFLEEDDNIVNYHHVFQCILDGNSSLKHYKVQKLGGNALHYYSSNILLNRNASYEGFGFNIGAKKSRQEMYAEVGEESRCDFKSIIYGNRDQHHDTYINFSHRSPRGYSNQCVKQILDDKAKGVFYGKAYIEKNCPGIEAHQLNKNILLSEKAQIFSKPELEIYTDDVKCTHGSTTGSLDKEALYYLKTRGLSENDGTKLLLEGFALDVLEDIKNSEIKEYIKSHLININRAKKRII